MKGKTGFFKTLRGGLFFNNVVYEFGVFSVDLLLTLLGYSYSGRVMCAHSIGQDYLRPKQRPGHQPAGADKDHHRRPDV